jgi:hypothetical protein
METQSQKIVIHLSKKKVVLLTLGAWIFVLLGVVVWIAADSQTGFAFWAFRIIAVLAIGFFGFCGIAGIMKLFDTKPGLVVDDEGIYDNSSITSGHLIKWDDVCHFSTGEVGAQRFLLIYVDNPSEILLRHNRIERIILERNSDVCGTPFAISANTLACSLEELSRIITDRFQRRKK